MVKLKDIAKVVGVSIATVSKALNNSHEISQARKDVIVKTAQEMGYIANSSARNLKTNRSYNIGVVYIDESKAGLKHEYFSTVLDVIKETLRTHGYDITFISNIIGKTKYSILGHARYRGCDGVIVVTADFLDKEIIELVKSNMPVITIDHVYPNRTAILSDNQTGLGSIVDYVYKQGHRRIAFIHGEMTSVTSERLKSFYDACERLKINVSSSYVKHAQYHIPKFSGLATRELLALEERPTCIIYPDDYSYMGGMTEIEKHGLKIPDDISVVGYDGIYLSKILRPRLTTYIQDSEEIGNMAALKIIEQIENPNNFKPESIIVKGHLSEGQTVRKIN